MVSNLGMIRRIAPYKYVIITIIIIIIIIIMIIIIIIMITYKNMQQKCTRWNSSPILQVAMKDILKTGRPAFA